MVPRAGRVEWALTGLLALALLWAPLPFGGVTPWAEMSLRVLVFSALGLAVLAARSPAELAPAVRPGAALAAVAVLGLLQSLPWPPAIAAAVSPEHARLHSRAAPLIAAGGPEVDAAPVPEDAAAPSSEDRSARPGLGGSEGRRVHWPRLSVAPSASRAVALGWAAAAAGLLAGSVAGRSRRRRRVLAGAVLAAAAFELLFGARGWLARTASIWGTPVPGSQARLRGTFVDPDHLALYLGIALPIAFAWGFWALRRLPGEPRLERRLLLAGIPCLFWLALFAGVALTGSRAGLAAALAAVALQGTLIMRARGGRFTRLAGLGALVGVLVAGLGVLAALGLEAGLGRLLATSTREVSWAARREAYAATLGLWRLFPATGAGLGSFRDAFPLVQPSRLAGSWWHAHSDPLELLATTGLLGVAIAITGVLLLLRRLRAVLRDGRRSEDRAAALAGIGMLAAAAVHETLDFGLSMPANALTLCILLGAAAAARTRQGDAPALSDRGSSPDRADQGTRDGGAAGSDPHMRSDRRSRVRTRREIVAALSRPS